MLRRRIAVALVPLAAIVAGLLGAAVTGSANQELTVQSSAQYFRGAGGCFNHLPNGDIVFCEFNAGQITGTFNGDFVQQLKFRLHPDGSSDFTGTATCGGDPNSGGCVVAREAIVLNFTLRGRGTWSPSNFVLTYSGTWTASGSAVTVASGARTSSSPRVASGARPTAPTALGSGSFVPTGEHSEQYTGHMELT